MIKHTVLSASLKTMFAAGVAVAAPAFAQEAQPMQRVEITGSSIKRIQTETAFHHKAEAYCLWNVSASYAGYKGLTLTAGIKNLLDDDPPFSNQGTMFQKGYDRRYSDPVGRALYLRASYVS